MPIPLNSSAREKRRGQTGTCPIAAAWHAPTPTATVFCPSTDKKSPPNAGTAQEQRPHLFQHHLSYLVARKRIEAEIVIHRNFGAKIFRPSGKSISESFQDKRLVTDHTLQCTTQKGNPRHGTRTLPLQLSPRSVALPELRRRGTCRWLP